MSGIVLPPLTPDSKMRTTDVAAARRIGAKPTVITASKLEPARASRIRAKALKARTRRRTWRGEPIGPDFFRLPSKAGLAPVYRPVIARVEAAVAGWGRRADQIEFAVGRYSDGQFLAWHMDRSTDERVYERSGCASWQISEGGDYEGGDLEYGIPGGEVHQAPRDLGSLVIFDPLTWHRVTPVTSGERWAVIICAYQRAGRA